MSMHEPLQVSYLVKVRARSSARVETRWIGSSQFEQKIVHAPLYGVTREMLYWWMHHIGDQVEWKGSHVKADRLWHPADHIDWTCDGPVRAGCKFRIVEAFQREARFHGDRIFDVPKLDLSGFRIESGFAGFAKISVDEDWEDVPGGVRWTNTMRIATSFRLLAPLVWLVRHMKRANLDAWIKHNIEEVGFIPEFLPHIWTAAHK